MTNTLLIIIAALLAARFILQVWQGRRAVVKSYCAPSEVEHTYRLIPNTTSAIQSVFNAMSLNNWEFVGLSSGEDGTLLLFFTRKRIKTFYEE